MRHSLRLAPLGLALTGLALIAGLHRSHAQYTVTPVDCSVTIASTGTPQQMMGPNLARHGFLFQNVGSSNVGWSDTNSSPSIGAAGTFTLVPGGSVNSTTTGTPGSAIWVVGTSGTVIACQQNN